MENDDEKIADELFDKVSHGDQNAFHELEKLAEAGNARAMSNMAQIYLKGFGLVESSYEKAVNLLKKAAALDEVYALFRLGEFYRDAKYGFKQDGQKAAEYFIRAAGYATPNGAAEGLRLAAEIYHYGKGGVAPNGVKAIELYEKLDEIEALDEIKSCKALFRIAEIYTEGCGSLQPDGLKAVEYLNKAAERGDDQSAFRELANLYRKGKAGLKIDGYKVIEYLTKLDNLTAIAEIYRDGKYNVKADGYKAVDYFTQKARRDKRRTLDELAQMYLINDVESEMSDANDYYSYAKEIGHVDEFKAIAEIFLEGSGGIRPDGQKAVEYFLKAAEGLDKAIEFTESFVERNVDIKQNKEGVLKRFFLWSGRKRRNIHKHLAEIYSKGKADVRPDGYKAIEYFLKVIDFECDNNDECGLNVSLPYMQIAEIYLKGKAGVQIDGYKAIEYFEKVANFKEIAEIYRYGKAGVEPNPLKAIEYFLKYEAASRCPDNELDEFYISLAKDRRADAFRNIAEIYYSLNDGQRALEYFLKADECDDAWAYMDVAKIYREGKGNLKPDGVKLVEYLTKKLEQLESPDRNIIYEIAKAYEEGCGSLKPNIQKSLEFHKKFAALGNDSFK